MFVRKRVTLDFDSSKEPSLTKQSFKDECDINKIVKRFKKIHGVEMIDTLHGYASGNYGDFSNVTDYRSALEQIDIANDLFMNLPPEVRRKFDNDAALFLDYCQNPSNADELVKMGLAKPTPPAAGDQKP